MTVVVTVTTLCFHVDAGDQVKHSNHDEDTDDAYVLGSDHHDIAKWSSKAPSQVTSIKARDLSAQDCLSRLPSIVTRERHASP